MRRWSVIVALVCLATGVQARVFERYLSADRPSDRAIMAYLELEKSGKATSTDLTELAVLLVNKGFPGDAEDYLRAALKMDKHNHEAAFRLGLVLQRQGRDLAACKYYKRTLKERPGYGPARFMLALAEERAGRTRSAVRNYAKAYRYAPDLADPAKNPLVLDSKLQTQALLEHYRDTVDRDTYHVLAVDEKAVQQMMLARPASAAVPGSVAPVAPPSPPAVGDKPAAAPRPATVAAPAVPVVKGAPPAPTPAGTGSGTGGHQGLTTAPARLQSTPSVPVAPPAILPISNVSSAR